MAARADSKGELSFKYPCSSKIQYLIGHADNLSKRGKTDELEQDLSRTLLQLLEKGDEEEEQRNLPKMSQEKAYFVPCGFCSIQNGLGQKKSSM